MKKLTTHASLITINHYKNVLAAEGIEAEIRNQHLGSIMGDMPFVEVWPELWVKNDLDFDRARQLIDGSAFDDPSPVVSPPMAADRAYGMPRARSLVPAISLLSNAATRSG